MTDELQHLSTYRTVWALCDVRKNDRQERVLNASHYAVCLTHGRDPFWALFSARTGRVDRWFNYRYQIEAAHPNKSWRRMTSSWTLGAVTEPMQRAEIIKQITAQKEK